MLFNISVVVLDVRKVLNQIHSLICVSYILYILILQYTLQNISESRFTLYFDMLKKRIAKQNVIVMNFNCDFVISYKITTASFSMANLLLLEILHMFSFFEWSNVMLIVIPLLRIGYTSHAVVQNHSFITSKQLLFMCK